MTIAKLSLEWDGEARIITVRESRWDDEGVPIDYRASYAVAERDDTGIWAVDDDVDLAPVDHPSKALHLGVRAALEDIEEALSDRYAD